MGGGARARERTADDARRLDVELMSRRSVELGVSMTRPVSASFATWSWRDAGSRRGPARNAVRPSNCDGGAGTCKGDGPPYAPCRARARAAVFVSRCAFMILFDAFLNNDLFECDALCETSSMLIFLDQRRVLVEAPSR